MEETLFTEKRVQMRRGHIRGGNTLDKVMVKIDKSGWVLEMFRCGIW